MESYKERIKELDQVKTFQNEQRIHYGRKDGSDLKNRSRVSSEISPPVETYDKLQQQRQTNKTNSDRTNLFINENEPLFINSMSRTMDVFDVRMQTFGGKSKSKLQKKPNFDKFIAEKRGFIRASNLYHN